MNREAMRRWLPGMALGALALVARAMLYDVPPQASESLHFAVAREFGSEPRLMQGLFQWYTLKPFLLSRPLFYVGLWLPSQVSFEAARAVSLVVAASIPVLVQLVARRAGANAVIAASSGVVAALHPLFVIYGARIDPVQWMSAAFLGAMLACMDRRPMLGATLLGFAIGCDRMAIVGGAWLVVVAAKDARGRGEFRAWPLRADTMVSALLLVLALAPLPMIYSARPTFDLFGPAALGPLVSTTVLSPVLLVVICAGLLWPRTRAWSALALLYPVGFALVAVFLGRSASADQTILAAALALVAAAVVVQEIRARTPSGRAFPAVRLLSPALAVILLLPVVVALPASLHPPDLTFSAAQASGDNRRSNVVAAGWLEGSSSIVLVDVEFESLYHPFHLASPDARLRYLFSGWPTDVQAWAQAIEANETTTLVAHHSVELNLAVRSVYADCVQRQEGPWTLIVGAPCAGRAEQLFAALLAHGDSDQ